MIIEPGELSELKALLHTIDVYLESEDDDDVEGPQEVVFFAHRPHLLMALGYDEFRTVQVDLETRAPIGPASAVPHIPFASFDFPYESFYRAERSGAWTWFEGVTHYSKDETDSDTTRPGERYLHFVGAQDRHEFIAVSEWFEGLQRLSRMPDASPRTLLLPSIWTPRLQLQQHVVLAEVAPKLVAAVAREKIALREIPWRRLEELVAELLRSQGLEIYVTPRSRDGGRDIVARGELIPGEPSLIAVEVKQKAVVGIEDVQRALRANEDFPGLLLATAGRFSAGVVREKQRHRNQLRLFLKDGLALRQWIDAYYLRSHSPNKGPI